MLRRYKRTRKRSFSKLVKIPNSRESCPRFLLLLLRIYCSRLYESAAARALRAYRTSFFSFSGRVSMSQWRGKLVFFAGIVSGSWTTRDSKGTKREWQTGRRRASPLQLLIYDNTFQSNANKFRLFFSFFFFFFSYGTLTFPCPKFCAESFEDFTKLVNWKISFLTAKKWHLFMGERKIFNDSRGGAGYVFHIDARYWLTE